MHSIGKIVLLGDSLTQLAFEGWGAKLANVYQRRADVVNRGCSGYNTAFYRRLLPLEPLQNVVLVTIFFGANDAALENENPHHFVSVADYTQNLKDLVAHVREVYPKAQVLLITPPPLDHEQRLAYQKKRWGDKATGVLERTTENTKLYADACVAVGSSLKIPCVNLFDAMLQQDAYGRFFNDGLHFSFQGHAFVADQVLQSIGNHFPDLVVAPCSITGQFNNSATKCPALASLGPYHDQIKHDDVDAAFRKGS